LKKFENFLNFFSTFNGKVYYFGKNLDFCCKKGIISCSKRIIRGAYSYLFDVFYFSEVCFEDRVGLFTPMFRDWQAEFGEDFFHIFPDPFAIFLRIVAQKICGVIRCHKFYW
jgi:hypothetical protein